jgi:hypothetical protein
MSIGLQVMCPSFLSDFNETAMFLTDFRNILKYKTSRNPSNESLVFPCGETGRQTDRQTDMTKLIVTFRNFANAPDDTLKYLTK